MQNRFQVTTGTINARSLKEMQGSFERFWRERLLNLKRFLEEEGRASQEKDMKARVDALESELNNAIIGLSNTDFLLGNFDLQALFLESLGRYYSDDVVLWLQGKLTHGKMALFQRMAGIAEPIYTFIELGMASVDAFGVTGVYNGPKGKSLQIGRRCSAGRIQQGLRFAGVPLVSGKTGWSLPNALTVCDNR